MDHFSRNVEVELSKRDMSMGLIGLLWWNILDMISECVLSYTTVSNKGRKGC